MTGHESNLYKTFPVAGQGSVCAQKACDKIFFFFFGNFIFCNYFFCNYFFSSSFVQHTCILQKVQKI